MSFGENCPRFHSYITRNTHIYWLEKSSWALIEKNYNKILEVDIDFTPLSSIGKSDNFILADYNIDQDNVQTIEIYRYDNKDPKPINKDKYLLIADIFEYYGEKTIETIVTKASTELNQNLVDNLNTHIILKKIKPGYDHHLDISECPSKVRMKFVNYGFGCK